MPTIESPIESDAIKFLPRPGAKRILILGGGFSCAYTALHLEKQLRGAPDIEVMIVAKENFVLFTPDALE